MGATSAVDGVRKATNTSGIERQTRKRHPAGARGVVWDAPGTNVSMESIQLPSWDTPPSNASVESKQLPLFAKFKKSLKKDSIGGQSKEQLSCREQSRGHIGGKSKEQLSCREHSRGHSRGSIFGNRYFQLKDK